MSNPIHPTSQTPQQMTLAKLKQLMPESFSEGQLDISKLTALLSEQDIVPNNARGEAYGLSWAGKHQVYRELKTPTSQTLLPQPEESVNFDTSKNLFIEGDNLAVLKILQKSYHSRIKMIYIDPPYNTGNDRFVYVDDFSESIADYKARAGQTDEDGNLTHSDGMRGNRKENGQYHSNWLNMMYPRLALAKSLLRDDGVIFVSIDDNEVANLRLLMDEIFGEENFLGTFCVVSTPNARDYGHIGHSHDYIVFYARNHVNAITYHLPDENKAFKYSDNISPYNIHPLYNSNEAFHINNRPNLFYPFYLDKNKVNENGFYELSLEKSADLIEVLPPKSLKNNIQFVWRWGKQKSLENINKEIVGYKTSDNEYRIVQKMRTSSKVIRSVFKGSEYSNRKGTGEAESIFDNKLFSFPKPLSLLRDLMKAGVGKNDIILDFFAGSSTTAHAAMALNAEDAENGEVGKRKYIMVQIPEATEVDSEAYKAGYTNIAEISKERIRRAAAHIKAELPESVDADALDFGFKAYQLSDSNFIPWQQPASYDADSLMAQLEKHLDPISDNATTDGILTELMLKEGYTLTATVSKADGYYLVTQNDALHYSNDNADSSESAGISMSLAIVLDDMTTSKATQIIANAPNKTLIMDRAFSDDANKANIVLQFEDAGLVVGCV